MSLRKIAFDTAAMSSVSVLRMVAQFLSLPLLSRLLSPTDYGIVGMAMPLVLFAMMIADAGIGMSLVRTSDAERGVWSTCFWLSAGLGLVLAVVTAGSAPLAARALAEPRLVPVVMALAAVIFVQAVSLVPGAALQRNHRFKLIAAVEMAATATSIAAAVVLAAGGAGIWALVGQQLAFFGVRVILTLWFSPFRPSAVLDWSGVREHLIFGRDVLGVNIVGFLTRSSDNLIIGKAIGPAAVGVYAMAFQIGRLPMMLVSGPLQCVLFAQMSRIKDDTAAIRRTFLILTRILAILIFPSMGMVAAAHRAAFTVLLSARWDAAGSLFLLAAPACALQAVTGLTGTVMMVLGRTDIQLRRTVEAGVIWVIALLSAVWFGLKWTVVAYDAAVLLYSPRSLLLVLPLVECSLSSYARALATPTLATLACVAAFCGLTWAMPLGVWAQLVIAGALAALGTVASGLVHRRSLLEEVAIWRAMHAMGPG